MQRDVSGKDSSLRRSMNSCLCVDTTESKMQALMDQINRVKDLPFPVYESFPEWEARAAMDARENGDFNTNDPFGSQGVNGLTPMPYLGETKVIIIVTLLNAHRS